MYSIDEILRFLEERIGVKDIKADDDLELIHGLYGDDVDEVLSDYSKRFNVNLYNYLWYFHTREEGSWQSIGGSFFKPPNERVKRIPITARVLLNAANQGKWSIEYPPHTLPERRWDIVINQVMLAILLLLLIWSLV